MTTEFLYLADLFRAVARPPTLVELPRAKAIVEIATMLRHEQLWFDPVPAAFHSVPNKPVLEYERQPIWAEFVSLRLLESDGWQGCWVKNWGGRAFWRNPAETMELPETPRSLFRKIEARAAGRGGGCWDIFVWRGDDVLFIESKQRGKDRLRLTQRTWLESALAEGIALSSFGIVEWYVGR